MHYRFERVLLFARKVAKTFSPEKKSLFQEKAYIYEGRKLKSKPNEVNIYFPE